MQNVVVLGAGMVGRAMAVDLSKNFRVLSVDVSDDSLAVLNGQGIQTLQSDLKEKEAVRKAIKGADIVLNAVPGFMGFETLKTILEEGKNVVDISFMPEDSLELDELAKVNGVTAFVDCGVAPGMDNLILGHYNEIMKLTDFECLVGGLPKEKKWPFYYKAPFSPVDVIEEYTRPARYVENGHIVTKPAMSDIELIQMPGVGTLEAFNTDGLRSILFTMPHIPNRKEKTLRYPGHIEKIMALRDSGFFSRKPVKIGGTEITPFEFTSRVLFSEWKLGDTEEEITVMRITLKGMEKGIKKEVVYTLYDEYNHETNTSSMARTTGYTATAVINLFAEKLFVEKGVFPLEKVGKQPGCFPYVLEYLGKRGVVYKREEYTPETISETSEKVRYS